MVQVKTMSSALDVLSLDLDASKRRCPLSSERYGSGAQESSRLHTWESLPPRGMEARSTEVETSSDIYP